MPLQPLPLNAINRPPSVAVYIALAGGRRAVTKFSKPRVWDKVPEEALYFGIYPNFFSKNSVSWVEGNLYANSTCSRFDSIRYRRVTDRQTDTRRQLILVL